MLILSELLHLESFDFSLFYLLLDKFRFIGEIKLSIMDGILLEFFTELFLNENLLLLGEKWKGLFSTKLLFLYLLKLSFEFLIVELD